MPARADVGSAISSSQLCHSRDTCILLLVHAVGNIPSSKVHHVLRLKRHALLSVVDTVTANEKRYTKLPDDVLMFAVSVPAVCYCSV